MVFTSHPTPQSENWGLITPFTPRKVFSNPFCSTDHTPFIWMRRPNVKGLILVHYFVIMCQREPAPH